MISQMLKIRKKIWETYGVSWYNRDAKWSKDLQSEVSFTKQDKVHITKERLKKILGRMPNWKSPGPDLVEGFWLKNFSSLQGRGRLRNA